MNKINGSQKKNELNDIIFLNIRISDDCFFIFVLGKGCEEKYLSEEKSLNIDFLCGLCKKIYLINIYINKGYIKYFQHY